MNIKKELFICEIRKPIFSFEYAPENSSLFTDKSPVYYIFPYITLKILPNIRKVRVGNLGFLTLKK